MGGSQEQCNRTLKARAGGWSNKEKSMLTRICGNNLHNIRLIWWNLINKWIIRVGKSLYSGGLTFSFSLLPLARMKAHFFYGLLHLWSVWATTGWNLWHTLNQKNMPPLEGQLSTQCVAFINCVSLLHRYCKVTIPTRRSKSAVLCHIVASHPREVFVYSSFIFTKQFLRDWSLFYKRLWINHKKQVQRQKKEQFSKQQRENKQAMQNTNAITVRDGENNKETIEVFWENRVCSMWEIGVCCHIL